MEILLTERVQCQPLHWIQSRPVVGDQRLDLCDLYTFQSTVDKNGTVIILNANPNAGDFILTQSIASTIDNDGDYLTDIAFSYVFSKPQSGRQTAT